LTKSFIELLWKASKDEDFAYVIADQIIAMKDCIEEVNCRFLTRQEID